MFRMFSLLTIAGVFHTFAKLALSEFKFLTTLPALALFVLWTLAEARYRNLNVGLLSIDRRLRH
jgi:hypothetical protein